jgi:hypothetical protein
MDDRDLRDSRDGQRLFHDAAVARQFQRRLRGLRPLDAYGNVAPIQYDESGYPIERSTSLAGRVRRLITG